MKNFNRAPGNSSKQSGFFDLGISLVILALSGSVVIGVERNQEQKMASLQDSTEVKITGEAETSNKRISKLDSDDPVLLAQ